MTSGVKVRMQGPNGETLAKFAELIGQRTKYLGETSRESVVACAIQALTSIRAGTKVAKPKSAKVKLETESSLYCSFSTEGNTRKPCIRVKGSKIRYVGAEKQVWTQGPISFMEKTWKVFRFVDGYGENPRHYLIAAPSQSQAKQRAKKIAARRITRWAGLARATISMLMAKTGTLKNLSLTSPKIGSLAQRESFKMEHVAESPKGGTYSLTLEDRLRYAIDAVKGGKNGIDIQLKKAMNKIVSVINKKMPSSRQFFSTEKLPTPFPEVRRRK